MNGLIRYLSNDREQVAAREGNPLSLHVPHLPTITVTLLRLPHVSIYTLNYSLRSQHIGMCRAYQIV